ATFVTNKVHDIAVNRRLGRAGNADRLVQQDVDMFPLSLGDRADAQGLAINLDLIALAHLGADPATQVVDGNPPFGDQAISFAARAKTALTDVFVQAHGWLDRG